MTDMLYLTATEALTCFAKKTLSPVELLEAQIAKAEATKDTINAFTYTHFDEAMDAARASEARWVKGAPMGRLDGLPVAIKDESFIAGKPTSSGSLMMKDFVAEHTSPMNQPILAEGGDCACAHCDAGIFLCRLYMVKTVGCDAQSLEPGVYTRWIVGRVGCLTGGGDILARDRFGYRRLDPHSFVVLWFGGIQAALWAKPR